MKGRGVAMKAEDRGRSTEHGARSTGFTLIELLMVVVVILMLSALLFRVAGLVGDKTMRAKAMADIQNLQNALNEYMAEYGTYPPTSEVAYEYENTNMQPPVLVYQKKDPDNPLTDSELGYRYGLVAHLYERHRGTQDMPYNFDTDRDNSAKQRWAHYLKELNLQGGSIGHENTDYNSTQYYSNSVLTILDPWNRDFRYQSNPPYLSYRLWSTGPDGSDNTGDDISSTSQ
jgi:prepilin-type N-terminal cleavage/methylation domain-containing protein